MTMSSKFNRRQAIVLGAASLAVLPASGAFAQEKVVRVLRSPVGTFEGLYIAEEQGYFKEHGLKVEIAVGGAAPQNIAQLQAGQTDIIMTGSFELVAAVAQGLPIIAVLNTQDQGEVGTMGLLALPGSPIKTVADLRGKKIGLPGIQSAQGLAISRALDAAGLSINDVTLVNLPFDAVVDSLEQGHVDAAIPIGIFFAVAQSKGFGEVKEVYDAIKGTPAVIFAARKDWVTENAETMQAFSAAMQKAYEYGNAHPEAVRAIDTAQTNFPADYIASRYIAPFTAAFQRDKWIAAAADMQKYGYIPSAPAEADFIWDGAPQ